MPIGDMRQLGDVPHRGPRAESRRHRSVSAKEMVRVSGPWVLSLKGAIEPVFEFA